MYSYSFGVHAVEELCRCYPRASRFLEQRYPGILKKARVWVRDDSMPQTDWRLFKNLVKSHEKHLRAPRGPIREVLQKLPPESLQVQGALEAGISLEEYHILLAHDEIFAINNYYLMKKFHLTGGFRGATLREQGLIAERPFLSAVTEALLPFLIHVELGGQLELDYHA